MLALAAFAITSPALAQIKVTDAWVRGTVQGQTVTGAYMVIQSDRDTALVGASVEVAGHTAIHEMRMHENMMMMSPIERLAIPAGKSVNLDEHNYHIMLEDLKRQLKPGETVTIKLKFADFKGTQEDVSVTAHVRELSAQSDHSEHMHDGMGHE
jgi:hypothetical protein